MANLVSNKTTSVKIKQGILLGHVLSYEGQVVPEPFVLFRGCIGAVD